MKKTSVLPGSIGKRVILYNLKLKLMLTVNLIGNLGADAEVKSIQGKVYLMFRVAHSEKFVKADGTSVELTQWVSVISSQFTKLQPYLKKGQKVFVYGELKADVVWSPSSKTNVVGLSVNARSIELCNSVRVDDVPSMLYDKDGVQHNVTKLYWTKLDDNEECSMWDSKAKEYIVNYQGYVVPKSDDNANKVEDI